MSGSSGRVFFVARISKASRVSFGVSDWTIRTQQVGTSLIVLLHVSIGGMPSPSLRWNLKDDGFQKECYFQVNHVKLWKGIKLVLLNAASFPFPSICLLSEEFLQWFSVQALFLWRTRGRRGATWAMKNKLFRVYRGLYYPVMWGLS